VKELRVGEWRLVGVVASGATGRQQDRSTPTG